MDIFGGLLKKEMNKDYSPPRRKKRGGLTMIWKVTHMQDNEGEKIN